MVRKKTNSSKKPSIFAPASKVMIIERNKGSLSPTKKPTCHPSSLRFGEASLNKSNNSTVNRSQNKPKRKFSQALRAIREIKKFQSNTSLLIPKAAFARLVKEIGQNILGNTDIRFTSLSLLALQEATEMAIVNLLEVANLCSLHAKRVTLLPADIRLTRRAFGIGIPRAIGAPASPFVVLWASSAFLCVNPMTVVGQAFVARNDDIPIEVTLFPEGPHVNAYLKQIRSISILSLLCNTNLQKRIALLRNKSVKPSCLGFI